MPLCCCYVTAHGFGHAARAQAYVEELLTRPGWTAQIRTSAARWFFEWLLGPRCSLEAPDETLDPGVIQSDSFHHDLAATLAAWQRLLQRWDTLVEQEARHLADIGARVVVSDSGPLPLAAARRAGLPGLLVANFTWDWLLSDYLEVEPGFGPIVDALRRLYRQADLRLRPPMSHETDLFRAERAIGFTARRPRLPREAVRRRLGLDPHQLMVLLSFGGFGVASLSLERVPQLPDVRCVSDRLEAQPPHLVSARGLDLHYPDLIRAADVVLTKPGFSIIAEAVSGQTPLACVPRRGFRESGLLEAYLRRAGWPTLNVEPEALADGSWVGPVAAWARQAHTFPAIPTRGAVEAADAIVALAGA